MNASAQNSLPGVGRERIRGAAWKNLSFALFVTTGLFCLIPLSEFIRRSDEWLVREVEAFSFTPPPPPKTEMEKQVEKEALTEPVQPKLTETTLDLDVNLMTASLEVGPGDFKTAFSLANYDPAPDGFGDQLVFSLHELDRTPGIIKRGALSYPPKLKRKGLEGEVKLLVMIDEKGRVKVLEVVSTSHPDFVEPSRKAAENSVYQPPTRNGEKVKVQFFLPIRFTLLD